MNRIVISEDILFGKPRIKGTRISVEQVLTCLAQGWTLEQLKEELGISEKDMRACIEFAARAISRSHFITPLA